MKIEVKNLKAKLSVAVSAFDDKVVVEVTRATVDFNDKLATDLLDVAGHFDAKLSAELAVASTAVGVKHAAELASVFAEIDGKRYATQRECQDKLLVKMKEAQMYREK